jgi:hypothetical protein
MFARIVCGVEKTFPTAIFTSAAKKLRKKFYSGLTIISAKLHHREMNFMLSAFWRFLNSRLHIFLEAWLGSFQLFIVETFLILK